MEDIKDPNTGNNELNTQGLNVDPISELPTEEKQEELEELEIETSNDRTREQFNKLKNKNKELYEELKQLKNTSSTDQNKYESVYDTFKSDPFTSINTDNVDYIDEEGNVDIKKLNEDIKLAKMSALETRRLVEQTREDYEVREAHKSFPNLDPKNSEFDPAFFELVKDRILRKRFYEGQNIPLIKIAEEVSSFYRTNANQDSKKAVEEYKKIQQEISDNIPISNSNRIRQESTNLDDLRIRTQNNDRNAIIERLKALGI